MLIREDVFAQNDSREGRREEYEAENPCPVTLPSDLNTTAIVLDEDSMAASGSVDPQY